jgi:NADH pyrophosphatase NudC (nudix superfamily)
MSHGERTSNPHGLSDIRAVDDAVLEPPTVDAGAGRGVPTWLAATLNYCSRCGAALRLGSLPGEDRERLACEACGYVAYVNPRLVVTTLPVTDAGEVMLLRRGIEPGRGLWAQPGGFMEIDETVREGAIRETLEETGLVVEPGEIVGLYTRS